MTKLNIGCGENVRAGYTNIDIINFPDVTFGDITNLRSIKEPYNRANEILLRHVIEHFYFDDAKKAVNNCYSLLRWGGKLVIHTPDFGLIVKAWQDGTLNTNYLSRLIYGWYAYTGTREKEMHMLHKIIFDRATIRQFLEDAGFKKIIISTEPVDSLDEDPPLAMIVTSEK